MRRYLFLLLCAGVVTACTDWKITGTEEAEPEWGTASLCLEEPIAEGETLCYQIKIDLDTLSGESELAKSLAATLRDSVLCMQGFATIQETMKALADSMQNEWKAEMAEVYEPDLEWKESLQFYYTITGKPVENGREDVMSYQTSIDCYLGGAHGSYVVGYYNFDKETGKLLKIEDVVPAEKETEVLVAMAEQLCKDWEADDLEDLQEKTGITMLGDLYLTNNFLMKGDSLEFLFNQYEIAPYSAGLIGITIPLPANQ